MKGYKFSRAKLAATAVLGCLASSRGAIAEVLAQVGSAAWGPCLGRCRAGPHRCWAAGPVFVWARLAAVAALLLMLQLLLLLPPLLVCLASSDMEY